MYTSWSLKFGCKDPLYTFQVYAFASVTVDLAFSSSLVKFVSIQLWDVRCLSMIGRDLAFSTECSVCTFKQIVHVIWVWVHDVYVLLSLKFDCKDALYSFKVYAFASVTVDIVFFLLLWSNLWISSCETLVPFYGTKLSAFSSECSVCIFQPIWCVGSENQGAVLELS